MNPEQRVQAILDQLSIEYASDPLTRAKARAMFGGYVQRWFVDKRQWKIVAVEQEFSGPIINPATNWPSRTFVLKGKSDLIVEDQDEKVWYVEHKTAAEISGNYIDILPMDLQLNLSLPLLSREIGRPIHGVIFNAIAKTKWRLKKTERPFEYEERLDEQYQSAEMFHREKLQLSASDIRGAYGDLWNITKLIRDAINANTFHRNTGSCFDYFRKCPYFDLCVAGKERCDHIETSFYEHRPASVELSQPGLYDSVTGKRTLTQSAIKAFLACPQKYYYRYIKQIVKRSDVEHALHFGQAIHAALAAWYGDDDPVNYFKENEYESASNQIDTANLQAGKPDDLSVRPAESW